MLSKFQLNWASKTAFFILFLALSVVSFATKAQQSKTEVHLTILHLNDIYEISPVSGGKFGGVARVATLKKQLLAKNSNTYLTFSGDLYGPSGLSNVAIVDGELLAGKQAVAVMNLIGVDYATFGDHEFDQFSATQVLKRIEETTFPIISSNIADAQGQLFKNTSKRAIFTVKNQAGTNIRVGVFGITEPILGGSDLKLTYTDPFEAAKVQIAALEGQVDILIALTHFEVATDTKIAKQFPQIDLILGGDDHEHMRVNPGEGLAPIYKSDSNARNVQIIDLFYDTATNKLRITDRLQPITDAIADDPKVQAEVDKWVKLGFEGLEQQKIKSTQVVVRTPVDLDGFATSIRNQPTELTRVIMRGIQGALPKADLGILSSGYIRLDDLIKAEGLFTEYDVIRTLPSDFQIVAMQMSGTVLKKVLDTGQAKKGSGDFLLLTENVSQNNSGHWLINHQPLKLSQTYQVACADLEVEPLGGQLVRSSESTLRQVFISALQAFNQ